MNELINLTLSLQNNTFSTVFVGQNLIHLITVDSTSDYLKAHASKFEPLPEGTVIMADHQWKGRGQQGSKWITEPGKNLTFSLLLNPVFLAVENQFLLNIAISLAIKEVLSQILADDIRIKWPNDIYYKDKKLGGILIENTLSGLCIKQSVIGVGINVNQAKFENELAEKATSVFQSLQKDYNLKTMLSMLCLAIEKFYLKLKEGEKEGLKQQYMQCLYKYGEITRFKKDGRIFEGKIRGVEDGGLILLDINKEIRKFSTKEIVFVI